MKLAIETSFRELKYAIGLVNFTNSIHICKYFFRHTPLDIEALIQKNILPVRKGRIDTRKIRSKSSVIFLYKVA